jgi:hypothetical protein
VARRCAFCGESPVTQEHVIPLWLSRHLRSATGGDGFAVRGAMMRGPRHVPLVDAQVKRACEDCNTGWMHDLEEACRDALTSMMDGISVDMAPNGQALIGRWAIKTAAMVEFTSSARTFLPDDLAALRSGITPDGHAVFLARYGGQRLRAGGRISYAPLSYTEPIGRTTLYAFTMQVAHLVIQAVGSGKAGGFIVDMVGHGAVEKEAAVRIVPGDSSLVSWPPRFALDDRNHELFEKIPLPKQ